MLFEIQIYLWKFWTYNKRFYLVYLKSIIYMLAEEKIEIQIERANEAEQRASWAEQQVVHQLFGLAVNRT